MLWPGESPGLHGCKEPDMTERLSLWRLHPLTAVHKGCLFPHPCRPLVSVVFYIILLLSFRLRWVFTAAGTSLWGGHRLLVAPGALTAAASRCSACLLGAQVSVVVAGGSGVVAVGLSCSMACGIFPDQGWNLCLLHWQADSLALSCQGNSVVFLVIVSVMCAR